MIISNKLFTLVLLVIVSTCSLSYARQERSQEAKDNFKYSHPCPSNGNNHGPCPGYVIDHIQALACGGADDPSNMQWQTLAESKAKDKWERKGCENGVSKQIASAGHFKSMLIYVNTDNDYHIGPRGGCFTYSDSGKKRYVAHSFCGD